MATTHSAPIDLYEEAREVFTEETRIADDQIRTETRRPSANGERDESATEESYAGLARVLGW